MDQISENMILISIKTPYAHAILEGSKKIELRRRFSEKILPETKLFIYATTPTKEILGECYLKKLHKLPINELWKLSCRDSMVSWESFKNYFNGVKYGYGLELHRQRVFETTISLSELREIYSISPPQSYRSVELSI